MTVIDKDNWVGIGALNLVGVSLPLRCGTKGALGPIMVVDSMERSYGLGIGEECSSLIEKRKWGACWGMNRYHE